MDFEFSPEEQRFREEVRAFLREELPPGFRGYQASREAFEATKVMNDKLAERGWLTMAWPKEYGGQDAPIWKQVVFKEEMTRHNEPRGPGYMAQNWIGPSIMMYGTEEQKHEHLGSIAAGKAYWCQGFSEPDAGSDLASMRTRAIRDGDEYVINGEKIWTSHFSVGEWMFLLARTDPDATKHRGISAFLLPLDTPGVRVSGVRWMTGADNREGHFYFEDARVPVSARLGPENEGWRVAMQALSYERAGIPRFLNSMTRLAALKDYAMQSVQNGTPLFDDPWVRQRFEELVNNAEVARLLYYRNLSEEQAGTPSQVTASAARIMSTLSNQDVARFAMDLLGDLGDVIENEDWMPLGGSAGEGWMGSLVHTIVAGSLEINKNQLATRGLGLPR